MGLADELGIERYGWIGGRTAIEQEIPRVVAALARVAELLAEATADAVSAEAEYRHWKAIATSDQIARERAIPEWKARASVEASIPYRDHHRSIAEATERLELIKGFQVALLCKRDFITALLASTPLSQTEKERRGVA